jgi:hypothetical protein
MNTEKRGKRENLMGKHPLKVQCKKKKQLCPSLQDNDIESGIYAK